MMTEKDTISFECRLTCTLDKLIAGFNVQLFRALSPAFPAVRILRFDGVKKDDLVELELNFFIFRWRWVSRIISSGYRENGFVFIDYGIELPPFLSFWEHHHILESGTDGSLIRDEITFSPGRGWPFWLVRLMIRIQMQPRAGIYKRWFEAV